MRLSESAEKAPSRTKSTNEGHYQPFGFPGEAVSSASHRHHRLGCPDHQPIGVIGLIGLILGAAIMASGLVQAKPSYDVSVNGLQEPPPPAPPPTAVRMPEGSLGGTATPPHTASPFQESTWHSNYADGTKQAIEGDLDMDADVDVDDYIIERASTLPAVMLEPDEQEKSQDLESLSLQSAATAAGTAPSKTAEDMAGRKNSFLQLGSQKVPATVATSTTHSGRPQVTPTEPARNRSSGVVRNSAVKVDGKHSLTKGQKTDAPMLNYIFDTFSSANKHHHHDQRYGPHFEDIQRMGHANNLTVQAGSSVHLNCRISLLQDKTVSWVRHNTLIEDNALDLLTVGMHTYTGDSRYKMEFQYPNNWRLKIANVKKDDEALYECQISTHPPRVIQIHLHVNAPKVMIVDEVGDPLQEKYYEIDSTLQLSCVVRNVAMTSAVVYWKHIDNILNYDVTRGGVSVKTELMEDGANSTLSIAKISKSDSGNYTCSISEYQNFTIVVHILNGESFAELHHGGAGVVQVLRWQLLALQLLGLLLLTTASSLRGRLS